MRATRGVSAIEVDGVIVAELDDGKVNAFSEEKFAALEAIVVSAGEASKPVVVAGRTGFFSAGLDLGVVRDGDPVQMEALGDAGDRLFMTMRTAPVPIVAACTGHALAAGALLLLCCDLRLGLGGDYGIGLIEVAAGIPLPRSVLDLAELRLARQHLLRATVLGERWAPAPAVDVGFLDRVVEQDLIACAVEQARALAALPRRAYLETKASFLAPLRSDA